MVVVLTVFADHDILVLVITSQKTDPARKLIDARKSLGGQEPDEYMVL